MTFFHMETRHTLCQYSDESLFGHFVTTLNSPFEQKLALEDKGYESGLENFDLPTPLQKAMRIHHVTSTENASFHLSPVVPLEPRLGSICRRLEYSSSDNTSDDETTPTHPWTDISKKKMTLKETFSKKRMTSQKTSYKQKKDDLEEDFQAVPLDCEHWTAGLAPDRLLCTHSHQLPHELCIFPCPYTNYLTPTYLQDMNLSDISESEDYMVVSSDEDIPSLEQ